ncbi:hypothetical protein BKI52_43910 [marine bacterium AO1-C]|nr:hypothetical protein BKI52_43910 [marine bacterium AO1-C]
MAKKQAKQALLDATIDLMGEKGFFGTGLNEVLSRSSAPKGSLYYYFPQGKNQLIIEALTLAGQQVEEALQTMLHPENDLKVALTAVFGFFADQLEQSDFKKACPIATVASESASLDNEIRLACEGVYTHWQTIIEAFLINKGWSDNIAKQHASFALNLMEGNLLMSRVYKDTSHLKQGLTLLIQLLSPKN